MNNESTQTTDDKIQLLQNDLNIIYKNYKSGSEYINNSPYAFLATSTRIVTYRPTKIGRIKNISVNVDSIGVLKIKFFSKNSNGTYKYEKEIIVSCVAGNNVFIDGIDFSDLLVEDNWYIGIFSKTVKIAYSNYIGENGKNGTIVGDVYGDNNILSLVGYSIALNCEIEEDSKINNMDTSITNNSNRISILENKLVSNKSITTTSFAGTSLPLDFIMNGTWSVNNGLQSPTSGDLATYVIWNKYCSLDRKILRMRIKINDATSKFSLIHKNNMYNGVNGTIAEIDCGNKKLNLYAQWDGTTTLPSIVKSADISFAFVGGRDYLVSLEKFAGKSTLTIIDTVTQVNSSLILDENVDLKLCGAQTGSPGIMFTSGNIIVKKFEFITPIGRTPYVAMFGDSITEGNSLYNSTGGYTNRYCYKIYEALNGDVAICGKSGETSTGLLQRYELDYFFAQYVMVLIGTNDTEYSTWLANINTLINRINKLGATPILSTIPPRADRQDFINQANVYIRSSGYTYVDYDSALTLAHDGMTQNPDLFLGDKIHPNPAGHMAMFNQAKIDLPFLFD
jgi:lysophospholipase L1-like esterase